VEGLVRVGCIEAFEPAVVPPPVPVDHLRITDEPVAVFVDMVFRSPHGEYGFGESVNAELARPVRAVSASMRMTVRRLSGSTRSSRPGWAVVCIDGFGWHGRGLLLFRDQVSPRCNC